MIYGPNLALNRPTYHVGSPQYDLSTSDKAVDGNPWTGAKLCSSYSAHERLFFRVDLGAIYPISHVELTPADDGNIAFYCKFTVPARYLYVYLWVTKMADVKRDEFFKWRLWDNYATFWLDVSEWFFSLGNSTFNVTVDKDAWLIPLYRHQNSTTKISFV